MWAIFQLVGGASRTAGRPFLTGIWLMAGTGALAALASWLTLPPRRSMLSRPRGFLWAVIVGVPVLVGAWLGLWHSAYPDPFIRLGYLCFALTVGTAPWPFLVLRAASARLDPRHPRLDGATLGTASGAWAAVVVEAWCPLAAPAHVAVGHVLPLVCLALAGALLGSRLHREGVTLQARR
jgi:hypothetical protein